MKPSIVGIRSSWTCALCPATENAYQLMRADKLDPLALPRSWKLDEGRTICGRHALAEYHAKVKAAV